MTSKENASQAVTPSPSNKDTPKADPKDSDGNSTEPIKRAPIGNYWRILAFGSRLDHALLIVGVFTAAASGVALPLMNIVFGHLVSDFNSYFIPGSGTTKAQFLHSVRSNALYILYLFVAKFFLTYIGAVRWTISDVFLTDGL